MEKENKNKSSIKAWLKETLIKDLFRTSSRPKRPKRPNATKESYEWAVLVVDDKCLQILQTCMQTHEITAENIASIEKIEDAKRPCVNYHAIYFLSPVHYKVK